MLRAFKTLQAMANDPKLNIRNNIGMRETQFFNMFLQKHCEITLNVFSCVFAWKIERDHAKCLSDKHVTCSLPSSLAKHLKHKFNDTFLIVLPNRVK